MNTSDQIYLVRWEIPISAPDPVTAARHARAAQTEFDSILLHFTVKDQHGKIEIVDLRDDTRVHERVRELAAGELQDALHFFMAAQGKPDTPYRVSATGLNGRLKCYEQGRNILVSLENLCATNQLDYQILSDAITQTPAVYDIQTEPDLVCAARVGELAVVSFAHAQRIDCHAGKAA